MRKLLVPFLVINLPLMASACAQKQGETAAPQMPEPTATEAPPPSPVPVPTTLLPTTQPPTTLPMVDGEPAFPQFPCQPPKPSDLVTLDRGLGLPGAGAATLGAVETRLKQAFTRAGFRQPRVYQTCGGFVVATSIERARADGRPFDGPERFVDLD